MPLVYSTALKVNTALEMACMMGIVEVHGAGILSGLNNIRVYPVSSERYASHFGFTPDEVTAILPANLLLADVMRWYNGYRIGSLTLINPWFFILIVVLAIIGHNLRTLKPYLRFSFQI
jgi:hypothetical protein